ncbi:hypothetical protein BJ944DRAFT_229925 [Cunninghamella echinulata]|nr:hypothetical protein BJ944DRAFT_229925 [Cunninghamella echinulata]
MDELLQSAHNWPVEDLTNEVQDLLLRESMSWLPWVDTNDTTLSNKNNDPLEGLDPQILAQSLQLDGLFGQEINFEQLDEVAQSALLYDELTYEPSTDNSPLSTPSIVQEEAFEEVIPQNDNVLLPSTQLDISNEQVVSENDDDDDELSGSSSDEDEEDVQAADSSDDDDDSDDEGNGVVDVRTTSYMYLPKRQIEEALLEKITHRLHADKLPGILSIVSASNDGDQREEEVEIDLSSLVREQLVRVMLYVDACIDEQQGGPSVKIANYIVKDPKASSALKKDVRHDDEDEDDEKDTFVEVNSNNSNQVGQKRKRKSNNKPATPIDGPISMAALTKRTRTTKKQPPSSKHHQPEQNNNNSVNSKRRRRIRKRQQDTSVSSSIHVKQDPLSIASTRPKRRAALHKRRMLEETLLMPSDDENDDTVITTTTTTLAQTTAAVDHEVLIVYSDEQMDFGVVENQTIVHQPSTTTSPTTESFVSQPIIMNNNDDEDDEDEEIDIM